VDIYLKMAGKPDTLTLADARKIICFQAFVDDAAGYCGAV
jgi:hypothetical protein